MRPSPAFITWKITCPSREGAQALKHWLSSRIDLGRVVTDTIRFGAGGNEKTQLVQNRLSEFFSDIRVLTDEKAKPEVFRLVFQRRPDAGRFWKDVMVNIVHDVAAMPETKSIIVESKGDRQPIMAPKMTAADGDPSVSSNVLLE